MQILAILGRQPAIGLAELESQLGADSIHPLNGGLATINSDYDIAYQRFGSVIKFAQINSQNVNSVSIFNRLIPQIIINDNPLKQDTKLKIGISDYTGLVSVENLNKLGLQVKKVLKNKGYSVRIIPNKSTKLGSAQVIHNKLTSKNGIEIVIFKNGKNIQLATSIYEQNIEAYSARDQARPKRDARVGMLPPKLAQTIINLATNPKSDIGYRISDIETNKTTNYDLRPTIMDPFCGTGVILQEATLMGYKVYGTDIDERMIRYSRDNLQWLKDTHYINFDWFLETADATSHNWRKPIHFVAAETYLGRPMSAVPDKNEINENVQNVNTIHKKFLQNLHKQISQQNRICLAVPAWNTKSGILHLPVLDQLSNLGYNRIEFKHVRTNDLIYLRPDQIVGRELVVLQAK